MVICWYWWQPSELGAQCQESSWELGWKWWPGKAKKKDSYPQRTHSLVAQAAQIQAHAYTTVCTVSSEDAHKMQVQYELKSSVAPNFSPAPLLLFLKHPWKYKWTYNSHWIFKFSYDLQVIQSLKSTCDLLVAMNCMLLNSYLRGLSQHP